MSRRTQLTTKYLFSVLAQLSENFIFIYLGLTLFTDTNLRFNPLFILVAVIGICGARWMSVFPLSRAINYIIRYRAKRHGKDVADELPFEYQAMLFWAGLRGAVGVALAAGMEGSNGPELRATVLVVVVLTVIIFGGTTARMLEILGIRTGVVEEIDSDDEFDIETSNGGTYYKRAGTGVGHTPRRSEHSIALDAVGNGVPGSAGYNDSYTSGNNSRGPTRPASRARKSSTLSLQQREQNAQRESQDLLSRSPADFELDDDEDGIFSDDDLPPPANSNKSGRKKHKVTPPRATPDTFTQTQPPTHQFPAGSSSASPDIVTPASSSAVPHTHAEGISATTGAIRDLFAGATEDSAAWFRQLDEGFIKPHLLLDQGQGGRGGAPGPGNV